MIRSLSQGPYGVIVGAWSLSGGVRGAPSPPLGCHRAKNAISALRYRTRSYYTPLEPS